MHGSSKPALGLAFEHASHAAIVIDPGSDRIIDANDKAAVLLGRQREAMVGMRASALHPEQLPALIVFAEAVLLKGAYWTQTLSPRHANGHLVKLEYSATRLPTPNGPWMLIDMHDIVERQRRLVDQEADLFMRSGLSEWQRTERFFQDIERENRLILNAAGDGIYGVNHEGITTFVNPAAERMLGWKASEIVGREMHRTVHHTRADGSSYPNECCPIYAAFREGEVKTIENEVFWRKDGTPLHVEYTSTPLQDRGSLIGAVIVFRDVTQRKETEERLRRALGEVEQLKVRLERENEYLQDEIRNVSRHRGIIGRSAAIQKTLSQIELVAPTDSTVLIVGESGTGKELIASAIHEASQRSARPLIRVNCAAIPRELFESEFFGHAKGAFTGAIRDRVGRFELADGGTIFLDEVGEIPLELQGKLLRVIQEKQLERVGEEKTRRIDVRILAATNRSLLADVKAGRFREDLYYRLDVFPIQSVPLRDRPDDIAPLAQHALDGVSRKLKQPRLRLTGSDIDRLRAYDWPGNVRELENVIERGAILASDGRLRISLPVAPSSTAQTKPAKHLGTDAVFTETERRRRDRENIVTALRIAEGRIFGPGGAAEMLGIPPTTLASRMKTFGIEQQGHRRN